MKGKCGHKLATKLYWPSCSLKMPRWRYARKIFSRSYGAGVNSPHAAEHLILGSWPSRRSIILATYTWVPLAKQNTAHAEVYRVVSPTTDRHIASFQLMERIQTFLSEKKYVLALLDIFVMHNWKTWTCFSFPQSFSIRSFRHWSIDQSLSLPCGCLNAKDTVTEARDCVNVCLCWARARLTIS